MGKTASLEHGCQQSCEPPSTVCGCPEPRCWGTVPTCGGLLETMRTTLSKARLRGQLAYTLVGVLTQTLENLHAFGPHSPVGRSSEG